MLDLGLAHAALLQVLDSRQLILEGPYPGAKHVLALGSLTLLGERLVLFGKLLLYVRFLLRISLFILGSAGRSAWHNFM